MTLVRTTLNRASLALGIVVPVIKRLIALKALDGDLELARMECWVEYDPAWTRLDIWRRYVERGFAFMDEADVVDVVEVKKKLSSQGEPWDDGFLRAFAEVRGGRKLTMAEALKQLRGYPETQRAAVDRYAQLMGTLARAGRSFVPMELDDMMEDAPDAMQALGGTCLDEAMSVLFEKPDPAWIAQVGAMPPGHARWVATLTILSHPTHGGLQVRVPRLLDLLESIGDAIGTAPLSDGAAVEGVMRGLVREGDGALAVGRMKSYSEIRELILAWIEWQAPDPESEHGAFLLSLLPAEMPTDLRALGRKASERVTLAALKARAITAGDVARRASARLSCMEGRLRQWDRLCNVVEQGIAEIEADLNAGREVEFPVRVSDTHCVIRPDGSLVPDLRQTVDLEILPEDMLWFEAAEASGWDDKVRAHLSAAQLARSPAALRNVDRKRRYAPSKDGVSFVPGGERRFHVRYVGTSPAGGVDDEHHPPFLVELYAGSALQISTHMTREQVRARNDLVDRVDLPRVPLAMMGLTWWNERGPLAPIVLRFTGGILLPYRQLRLALAYGYAIGRLELMTGLRIGESMQAREGDCFTRQALGERVVATMRGRPKGARRDRTWIIDDHTMSLLKRIKGWVIANWYAETGALPFVEYAVASKNKVRIHCPPARYLFQMGGRAASHEDLNMCLRIATLGMPQARSHDYRFAFGKLLRIRKATGRQRARALSHAEASPMVGHYGDWECEGLDEDDAIVAAHQEQLERELMEYAIHG